MVPGDLVLWVFATVFVAPALIAFGLIYYPVVTLGVGGALALSVGVWWAILGATIFGWTAGGALMIVGPGLGAAAGIVGSR